MTDAILIVDDSLTVRMDLSEALEGAGFRTIPCATVAEARAALARETPSLIVLDVLLPDGDGVDLLKEIRASAAAKTPVLMLSTEGEVKDRIRGLQRGATDYVGKPYDINYVVARARDLLAIESPPEPTTGTILIIDDSATFRDELGRTLEGAGYAVLTAANGIEGLRTAARCRPNAVLVDGVLPGLDGAEVIRKIRLDAALRGTPCVLLTGSQDRDAELRALDAGADAFVHKEQDQEVILARVAAVLRASSSGRAQTASLSGPKRILAVDDSLTYGEELSELLRVEGYEVVVARSGEEGLEMLGVQSVDCILLDLVMPGLSGEETCRRIKESPAVRDVPLIMLTALEDRNSMISGLGAGADDFISKSSHFEVLKARIGAQLRRKQFEDEHRRIRDELIRVELAVAEERAARLLAETRAELTTELERRNGELEAFTYSVSHDLRAPLRSIDGFSQALLEEYSGTLDDVGRDYLRRVSGAARRMNELIDDLLELSRVGIADLHGEEVDLSAMVRLVTEELRSSDPGRRVDFVIQDGAIASADRQLIRVLFENLLGNAWKFTSKRAESRIEFGAQDQPPDTIYYVRDNGAGFEMSRAANLFAPFRRLHSMEDYPGTGIGLATVYRIVDRHGGRVWAEGVVGEGATVFFVLAPPRRVL